MKLIKNNEIDIEAWESFLLSSKFSSPFQTPDFFNIYKAPPEYDAEVYAVEENERLVSLCIVTVQKESGVKGYFSKRGIIYGGPLVKDNRPDALELLLTFIDKEIKGRVIYLETRNLNDYVEYKSCFEKRGWNYERYLNFEIKLENEALNDILTSMKYNRKREISLSIGAGATYQETKSREQITELYAILKDLYNKRVKLPLPNLDYFLKLSDSSIGKIFIVLHENKIIGGSFCYYLKNGSIYTLYYCGLRDYNKKIFPTHLSILAAIDFGLKNGLKTLDLMGAGKPSEKYGVRNYKAEFGGTLLEFGRFVKVTKPFLYSIGKFGLKLIRKIK